MSIKIYDVDRDSTTRIQMHQPISPFDQMMQNAISSNTYSFSSTCPVCSNTASCLSCLSSVADILDEHSDIMDEGVTEVHVEECLAVAADMLGDDLTVLKVEGDLGDCGICLEEFKLGEYFKRLPCSNIVNHLFHPNCIDKWLENNDTCPMCRACVKPKSDGNLHELTWGDILQEPMF